MKSSSCLNVSIFGTMHRKLNGLWAFIDTGLLCEFAKFDYYNAQSRRYSVLKTVQFGTFMARDCIGFFSQAFTFHYCVYRCWLYILQFAYAFMQAGAITQLSKISKLIEQLRHQESGYLGILMKVIVC